MWGDELTRDELGKLIDNFATMTDVSKQSKLYSKNMIFDIAYWFQC